VSLKSGYVGGDALSEIAPAPQTMYGSVMGWQIGGAGGTGMITGAVTI